MIYLIDDKTNRQQDFGWDEIKLKTFKDDLVSFLNFNQMESEEQRKIIFSNAKVILFHESFFENIDFKHRKDGNEIKNDLVKFSKESKSFKVVFFSGSYNSREINETGGSLPVSILYQNLECFLQNYRIGELDLNYLFFGENIKIEPELINKNENANSLLIAQLADGNLDCFTNNIIITGNRLGFPNPFNNICTQTIFNKNINDNDINSKIVDWFTNNEYDKIFIPLCFGPTFSDYNGLRLATHIRCTSTLNQLKPIFIYGFVDHSFLIDNDYFDILKTKNIFLISYSKTSFSKALNMQVDDLTLERLPHEIKKLNLKIPNNYEDNHSIANEWAIYRWSQTIDAKDENIEKIIELQNSNLYFKYLKTIHPIKQIDKFNTEQLKIKYEGSPKILYIDDEAEKGWYEIFDELLHKNNKLSFYHLDDEFNETAQDEIVNLSIKAVIEKDIDLVILDFRLHKDDFGDVNINEITGYKILKKIKEYNKGIQVIVFSATNKVWNLQAFQDAGADGFIIKESPENSIDYNFTKEIILNFLKTLEESLNLIFLKQIRLQLDKIKKLKFKNPEYAEFFNAIENDIDISFELLCKTKISEKYFNYAYLQLFQLIESFISLESVFIEGDNSYVIVNKEDVCVQKKYEDKITKSIKLTRNGKYEINQDNLILKNKYAPTKRLDTNFKVSSVLIYKYGEMNSSVKNWTNIYTTRNTKAAHYNSNNLLKSDDIFAIIEFIIYFLDASNESDKNMKMGLNIEFKDQIVMLKNKFNTKKS
jgi:CheY-like chemotaxis protein